MLKTTTTSYIGIIHCKGKSQKESLERADRLHRYHTRIFVQRTNKCLQRWVILFFSGLICQRCPTPYVVLMVVIVMMTVLMWFARCGQNDTNEMYYNNSKGGLRFLKWYTITTHYYLYINVYIICGICGIIVIFSY